MHLQKCLTFGVHIISVGVFVFYFEFDLNLSLRVMSPWANNLLCFRPPTVWDAGRKERGSGRQRRWQCTDARANVGYRNPRGCRSGSGSRNQHCEPKKISVQKTPKPQRFRGFVLPFLKCNSKDIISPKKSPGRT